MIFNYFDVFYEYYYQNVPAIPNNEFSSTIFFSDIFLFYI